MYTMLVMVISVALGVGSTLLVQTVILAPVPVVVACPASAPQVSPEAFGELDTQYHGQGRLLPMPRTGGKD
jgi:hypothetical protein